MPQGTLKLFKLANPKPDSPASPISSGGQGTKVKAFADISPSSPCLLTSAGTPSSDQCGGEYPLLLEL